MYATLRRNAQAIGSALLSNTTATRSIAQKPPLYGQPVHPSHPHLVQPNELVPGFSHEEFERRRAALMASLPDDSMVLLTASPVTYMSQEIFYKFRQNSDMWYLTGCEEPDSAVVLEKNSSSRGYSMTMFVNQKDALEEKWNGPRTGVRAACELFGADNAHSIKDFPNKLKSIAQSYSAVFSDIPPGDKDDGYLRMLKRITSLTKRGYDLEAVMSAIPNSRKRMLRPKIAPLRAVKSEAEQRVMRAAADISGRAHAKTMRFTHPGMSEASIAAHFEYLCALDGSQRPAYVPVVASGANALMIHYTNNNMIVENEDLILIDAGCEYNGYASDITRTYPANGTFTSAQRDLYSAVLSAQKQLVMMCSENAQQTMSTLHAVSCRLLRTELIQVGLEVSSAELSRDLYPHSLSHPLGIDLHESFTIPRTTKLEAGMVITIEPGIYVPPLERYPKHFWNLGVRIEDDVLVGKEAPTVLSVSAPKEIADVEGACQGLLGLEPY